MQGRKNRDEWGRDPMSPNSRNNFAEEEEDSTVQITGMFGGLGIPQSDSMGDFLTPAPMSEAETTALGKESIRSFLKSKTVYDAMPKSGRVLIFDVNINLKVILYALLEHEIRGAPLWNPLLQKLVGMVTLTDFADLFRHCAKTGEKAPDILENHTILSWRTLISKRGAGAPEDKGKSCAASLASEPKKTTLIYAPPTTTLYEACATLKREGIHRLPIIDTDAQTCLQVLTYQTILEYLTAQFSEDRRLFDQSIYSLGIGTYAEPQTSIFMGKTPPAPDRTIVVASAESTLREVSEIFLTTRVSTIPIIEPKTNKVRDICRRSFMAPLKVNHPNVFDRPIREVFNEYESNSIDALEPVHACSPKQTLFQVLLMFAERKTRTLVITDNQDRVCGMCSLSDVLCYFL
jgi:5'-AMP-activated protein kinase regulatory gamma subunit